MVVLKVSFILKAKPTEQELRDNLGKLVEIYKDVPGLTQKYFLRDLKTGDAGGMYVFESQAALDKYLESDLYHNVVLDKAKEKPRIETSVVIAAMDAGVLM